MNDEIKKIKYEYDKVSGLLDNVKIIKNYDKLFYNDNINNIDYKFLDYNNKYNYILSSLSEAIDNYDDYVIKNILNYFEYEIKVKKQRELQDKLISLYQSEIDKIKSSGSLNIGDISSYFECLRETLKNYDEKELGSNYSFYSSEMNNSIHRGLNMDFSISKKELPHLLGLRNPLYDKDDLLLDMYHKYLNNNNLEHSEDNYLIYLKTHYEIDLLNLLHSNNLNNKDFDMIKSYIIKSFEKCLTFIRIYEYKRIPEIIVDYQMIDNYSKTFSSDHTKDLITKASSVNNNPDLIPKKKLTDINIHELSKGDLDKLKIIWKIFNVLPEDIYIKYNFTKNEYDFNTIVVNDVIYSYRKNNYWSELNPNIFLVSYDEKEYKKEHKLLKKYLDKALKILGVKLKKDLNINDQSSNNEPINSIFDSKRNRLINLDKIKETIETINDEDIKEYQDDFDIIFDEKEEDYTLSKEDYDNLKDYMENIFGNSLKNKVVSSFNITDKLNEQPHIRMIHRIMDKLLRKDKNVDYPKKNISIIGFGTIRNNHGKFIEKFAKTLMGKTFLQLEYDLRVNGYSYKLNGIVDNNKKIYYNYDLLIDDQKIYNIYNKINMLVHKNYNEKNLGKTK